MTNATRPPGQPCPYCGESAGRTDDRFCRRCGVDLNSDAAAGVSSADAALATLRSSYDQLAQSWVTWSQYRDAQMAVLRDTAIGGDRAGQAAPQSVSSVVAPSPMPAPTATATARPTAETSTPTAEPSRPLVPAQPPFGSPSNARREGASRPDPRPASAQAEQARRAAASAAREARAAKARRVLTAPALLGVSGAALLIAAAVVFVAIAWTTFSPLARGLIVTAVAVAVAALAVWLRRLELTISSGAVGVVSMGFAGAASIAFSRQSGALGAFDVPLALLCAAIAGLVLSRLRIIWVGSAAALAVASATVGFTIAATSEAPEATGSGEGSAASAIRIWTVTGTLAAGVLAATRSRWKWPVARTITMWAATIWLAVVGLSMPVWLWLDNVGRDIGTLGDAAVGLLPLVALVVLSRWWPLMASGPAALILTALAASAALTWNATGWQQLTAVAVAVAVALAAGPWAPREMLRPMLIGLSPGYLVVAVSSAAYSVAITIERIIAGTYEPDTQMWAGVAALVAGLSVAMLRLWKLDSAWLRPATVVGAVMVVTGAGIVAFGLAEGFGHDYHSAVAVALTIAAAGLFVSMLAWTQASAKWVTSTGAVAFLAVAAGHAAAAVATAEAHLPVVLAIALAPAALLIARGRIAPWYGLPLAVASLAVDAGALADFFNAPFSVSAAVMVTAGSVFAWTGFHLRKQWHAPVLVGAFPVFALGVGAAFVVGAGALARILGATEGTVSVWWTASALAGAVGLAALPRWQVGAAVVKASAVVGAVAVIATLSSLAFTAADAWGGSLPAVTAGFGLAASAVAAAFGVMWRSDSARWTNGIGATAMGTAAGLNAVLTVADGRASLVAPLTFAVLAIAALALGGRWWPKVTLGPAAALGTALAAAAAARAGLGALAAVSSATFAAAVVMWIAARLDASHGGSGGQDSEGDVSWRRRSARAATLAIGSAPALAAAAIAAGGAAAWSLVFVLYPDGIIESPSWWAVTEVSATGVAIAALSRVRAVATRRVWMPVALAVSAVLLAVTVTAVGAHGISLLPTIDDLQGVYAAAPIIALLAGAAIALGAAMAGRTRWLAHGPAGPIAVWGAVAWLTLVDVLVLFRVADNRQDAWLGGVVVGVSVAALALGARWWPRRTLTAATLLGSALPLALVVATHAAAVTALSALAAALAAGVWLISWRRADVRVPGLVGLAPAATVVGAGVMLWIAIGWGAAADHAISGSGPDVDGWSAALLALALVAAMRWRPARRRAGTLVLIAIVAAAAVLAPVVAVSVVLAAAVAGVVWAGRSRTAPEAALAATVAGMMWAAGSGVALALGGGALAVVGALAARGNGFASRWWGAGVAPIGAAIALGYAAKAGGAPSLVIGAAAMAGWTGAVIALAWLRWKGAREAAPWLMLAGSAVVPAVGVTERGAGVSLLVAAVGWYGLMALNQRGARWGASLTASLGVAAIVHSAGISAIEAYVAVPALAALAMGVGWMRSDAAVRSWQALAPGLALGLVPSYIALAFDPNSLPRTFGLTVATVVLALLGVRLRWFAPILATASTAVVVSVLQLVVGSNLLVRLVSFVVVGSLLLAIASFFERLKDLR